MSVYVIFQLDVHDPQTFGRYTTAAARTGDAYGSEIVAVGPAEVVEGEWFGTRTVVARFPDRAAATAWLHSPAYREATRLRHAAATSNVVLVDGLPAA